MAKKKSCTVCKMNKSELNVINDFMLNGNTNTEIQNQFRELGFTKVPSTVMLSRHREDLHYAGEKNVLSQTDSTMSKHVNKDLKLLQHTTLQITKTILPRLSYIPKNLDVLEEKQEMYVFTKNLLVEEYERVRNTPELYMNPETEETSLHTPISPSIMKLMDTMNKQLKSIEESTKDIIDKSNDISSDISIEFMELMTKSNVDVKTLLTSIMNMSDITEAEYEEVNNE